MNTLHIPVLLAQAIEHLNVRSGGVYVDATFGGGGHTEAILPLAGSKGTVIAIDLNPRTRQLAERLAQKAVTQGWAKLLYEQANFADLSKVVTSLGFEHIDGVLFDLGLSSDLLDQGQGFSIHDEADLDMRFASTGGLSASDFVNYSDEDDLVLIFSSFGQARFSKSIAKAIVREREQNPITTAAQLTALISRIVPVHKLRKHPAIQIFQALRIATNQEFQNLARALETGIGLLHSQGRIVVISFHSLEDRVVKNIFKRASGQCVCFLPPELCKCDKQKQIRVITKKPLVPDAGEMQKNPRSRSAKLRAAIRI